ncbi:sigma-54-dependent Fis family transcriptional regulator [Bhargavaea massiliensis]|uniref:sigma-54-dependent Fis family transcriptional regulator n=1 Tax=Bhargavaea massiliensis TaxID=2697500 RepID=UPI001BCDCF29|nr:sigma-54-dependent Fis family transcriptional regulator [Bhargavaea massiliensis]
MNQLLQKAIAEPMEFNLSIKEVWKRYTDLGRFPDEPIRHEILESWEHSKSLGVDPFQQKIEEIISPHELDHRIRQNEQLLSYASPQITDLNDLLNESGTMLCVTDRHGTILDSFGDRSTLKRAEVLNIFEGGTWSESSAGTNAVGVALKTKAPAQVFFSEHFCEKNHEWYCMASPILAPFTKELVGIVNVAGCNLNLHPHTLKLLVSEAKNLSGSIHARLYEDAIRENLFLTAALDGTEDAVFVVDSQKEIINRNKAAAVHPSLSGISGAGLIKGLDSLLEQSMLTGQKIQNESIRHKSHIYRCSIYPLTFQEIGLGAVVFLRQSPDLPGQKKRRSTASSDDAAFAHVIGSSTPMVQVINQAKKAAAIDATLFLSGETGTGKEVFAQAIHRAGSRRNKPFVAINCGAIPPGLLESELSGYEAGSFTGAKSKGSPGKFEMAEGGTIFLDEIGDMPLESQVHLLRILEEREVRRIGGERAIPVDVRVIAGTHRDLKRAVEEGTFREDLLYRLKIIQLTLPPLRERIEDIPELSRRFIEENAGQFGKRQVRVLPETIKCLMDYHWPGNVRELKNVIQQALFTMDGETLCPSHLPAEISASAPQSEKARLLDALQAEDGVVSHAAIRLGISRATMYRRMKKYQLT